MSQVSVNFKFIVIKAGKAVVETKKAKISTNVSVEDFLNAAKTTYASTYSKLGLGASQQLFLCADPEERLDSLGIRDDDVIIITNKDVDNIIIPEN